MLCRGFIVQLILGSVVLYAALSAQISSIEGNVTGADGEPLKDIEIRFEQKGRQISPIISRTDANGHYTAALPRGLYKMTLAAGGAAKSSIAVEASGWMSRIDFELRASAERKISHDVWVGGETVSHLPGHWVEADIKPGSSPVP